MVLIGDVLDTLRECSTDETVAYLAGDAEGEVPTSARTLVVGVDLRGIPARGAAKLRLREAGKLAAARARESDALRHVVLATALDPRVLRHFERVASSIATHLHSELERASGRDIEVTLLDVSACDNGRLLFDRLRERSGDPTGAHGVVVLSWDDIRSRSIARAANEQYF
jgi:hypothetical protein